MPDLSVLRHVRRSRDAGMTVVELLVAMTIFAGLSTALFSVVLSTSRAAESNQTYNDLNEEARVVLNRMSRELREAKRIVAVTNPAGPNYQAGQNSSITFEVDFDGDGVIEPTAADPERLTYLYEYAQNRLILQTATASVPVLAESVHYFRINYRSRLTNARLSYDGVSPANGSCGAHTGVKDGFLDWTELDGDPAAQMGNCNSALDVELPFIDSVILDLTVLREPRDQVYRTQIDLRNNTD